MTKYADDDEIKASGDVNDDEPVDIDDKLEEIGMHPNADKATPLDISEQLEEEQRA